MRPLSSSARLLSTATESSRPSQDELATDPQALTPAQRMVAACPPAVQPYLQLMRVDRPIGERGL